MLVWGIVLYSKNSLAQNVYLLYEVAISLRKAVSLLQRRDVCSERDQGTAKPSYHKKEKQIS